jgi:sulfur carrier protein
MTEVSMNGRLLHTPAATLAELLRQQGYEVKAAMACAINRQFVPRAQWPLQMLQPGDRIDVIAPVTGG